MAEYTPLQEIAYNHVRKLVLSGQLQPNVLYSETKMAKEIEISRTPMKDALVRLSQDKFIDIIPSKGFRLHQMSKEDIWSTYQARAAVEGFCAIQLAHQRGTPEGQTTVRAMEQCLHDMERLLKEPDTEDRITGLLEQDVKFHQTLVDFCRNEELVQLFIPAGGRTPGGRLRGAQGHLGGHYGLQRRCGHPGLYGHGPASGVHKRHHALHSARSISPMGEYPAERPVFRPFRFFASPLPGSNPSAFRRQDRFYITAKIHGNFCGFYHLHPHPVFRYTVYSLCHKIM